MPLPNRIEAGICKLSGFKKPQSAGFVWIKLGNFRLRSAFVRSSTAAVETAALAGRELKPVAAIDSKTTVYHGFSKRAREDSNL